MPSNSRWGRPTDTRGLSPVIGVILMVSITVILAAVIGSLVLDVGGSAGERAPAASLAVSADATTENVTIEHQGGDGLASERLRLIVEADGETSTYEPLVGADASVLSVGEEATLNLSDPTNGVDWNGDGHNEWSPDGTISGIDGGDRITVELIDTESQRIVYETTVTA